MALSKTAMLLLIAAAALAPAGAAAAQTPPGIPDIGDLLPKGDVARFQVTVRGTQEAHEIFTWRAPNATACGLYAEGTLDEFWEYARGKGLVVEFRKVAGRVLLQRVGRQLGDVAFAAPGTVTRGATGFVQADSVNGGCVSVALGGPDCDKVFPARSDLRLGWSKGRLTLKESGPAAGNENPAAKCGAPVTSQDSPAYDQFSFPYPFLGPQRAPLPARRIFGSKRAMKLVLKHPFLGPVEGPQGYTTFTEKMSGSSTVTLKRLKVR
jgi:hypothetical protein